MFLKTVVFYKYTLTLLHTQFFAVLSVFYALHKYVRTLYTINCDYFVKKCKISSLCGSFLYFTQH